MVIAAPAVAIINAAVAFVDDLPTVIAKIGELIKPDDRVLGLTTPSAGSVGGGDPDASSPRTPRLIADAATASPSGTSIAVIAGLITAVIISVGLAIGQVSLLGWLRRFLPSSTYRDLTELERAIAVSFGGFVRGRLVIGAIYGTIVGLAAVVLGIPYGPLIAVIAGSDRVHPVDRTAHRLDRPAGLRGPAPEPDVVAQAADRSASSARSPSSSS